VLNRPDLFIAGPTGSRRYANSRRGSAPFAGVAVGSKGHGECGGGHAEGPGDGSRAVVKKKGE
jgi:hypothetical protein